MPKPVCLCPSSHSHDSALLLAMEHHLFKQEFSSLLILDVCLLFGNLSGFCSLLSNDMGLNTRSLCCDVCLLWGTLLCDSQHKKIDLREEVLDINTETSQRLEESGHRQLSFRFDFDNLIIFIFVEFFSFKTPKQWARVSTFYVPRTVKI